jgi:hypothetical protein
MLSVVLSKTFKKIRSLVLNCEKKRIGEDRETPKGGSKESISSVDNRSTQTKIPDPWFN